MGTIEFAPYEFNLKSLLLEIKLLSQPQATAKNIELKIDVPDELNVFADENMLGTVYRNLVTNAIKFTPRGGEVLLGTNSSKKSEVCLFVRDTGIGIDEDNLPKLFSLDKKISRPGTEGELSTGLGLIICKEFINRHGGEIWVESTVGKGTTFFFTLPMMIN
jgi:signal transduction histidine kinase